MDTIFAEITPAESFSAVVAMAVRADSAEFDANLATYSGSGMARTHDD